MSIAISINLYDQFCKPVIMSQYHLHKYDCIFLTTPFQFHVLYLCKKRLNNK